MSEGRPSLLVDTNPMAYGSSASALAVLDHVRAHRVALVRDVTKELLESDPAVDETIAVDVKDPDAVRRAIGGRCFDAVLVVSNLTNVTTYAALGVPVYFVDILFWYGAQKQHPVWDLCARAFVQRFPGVEERLAQEPLPSRRPTVVGPLVRVARRAERISPGTLVNLGGGRSRWLHPARDGAYLRVVAHVLEGLRDLLPRPIEVVTGRDAAAAFNALGLAVRACSLSAVDFGARLAACELFVSAPGLNAVLEAFALAKGVVFLPPQNASQVLQLACYERAGVVPRGLNLPDLIEGLELPARVLDEERYTREVLTALTRLEGSEPAKARVVAHVGLQARMAADGRLGAQQDFWRSLGPPGPATVAGVINAALLGGEE